MAFLHQISEAHLSYSVKQSLFNEKQQTIVTDLTKNGFVNLSLGCKLLAEINDTELNTT